MSILQINKLKIISPSPDNFILKLKVDDSDFNFIGSGEHIYENKNGEVDKSLITAHLAHSSKFVFSNNKVITAFNLFDINDMGITTHEDETHDNLLLLQQASITPSSRSTYPIIFHTINSNSTYGYISAINENTSFGYPKYESGTDGTTGEFSMSNLTADPVTMYHKRKLATSISATLGLGNQINFKDSFDKLVVFDPTDGNRLSYAKNLKQWRNYQSNIDNGGFNVTNNFDYGNLLVRSILFPKQTLNNEYSTKRNYLSDNIFNYTRKYNWNNDNYFYSNGNFIVFNSREDNRCTEVTADNNLKPGTMVTSTYSRQFGDIIPSADSNVTIITTVDDKSQILETDYNKYNDSASFNSSDRSKNAAIFKQYMPEILNRENETMSDTGLMTSNHKANIFDIDIRNFWSNIASNVQTLPSNVQLDIRKSIRKNLYELVEGIKPAHTHLYRVLIDDSEFNSNN